jgi:N-acetylmuramoyl-L-alanine amidase
MTVIEYPSPNYNQRSQNAVVDAVIIHYTDLPNTETALAYLTDPEREVSSHYLVDEAGQVFRLVKDEDRAWHAGVGSWQGKENVNDYSIGIELSNPGHSHGYQNFPQAQMIALVDLLETITNKHDILNHRILGHSDIAPMRKKDPGELFDWPLLANHDFGLWVGSFGTMKDLSLSEAGHYLSEIGYDICDIHATIIAFQRHFLPQHLTGKLDPVTGGRILEIYHKTFDLT